MVVKVWRTGDPTADFLVRGHRRTRQSRLSEAYVDVPTGDAARPHADPAITWISTREMSPIPASLCDVVSGSAPLQETRDRSDPHRTGDRAPRSGCSDKYLGASGWSRSGRL